MKTTSKAKAGGKKFSKVKKLSVKKLKELQGGCRNADCYGDMQHKSRGDYDRK